MVPIFLDRQDELRGTPAAIILVAIAVVAVALVVWVLLSSHKGRALLVIAIGLGLPLSLVLVRSIFHSDVFVAQFRDGACCVTFSAGVFGVGFDPDLGDETGEPAIHWLSKNHEGPHFTLYRVALTPSVWKMVGPVSYYMEVSAPVMLLSILVSWRMRVLRRRSVPGHGFEVRPPPVDGRQP